MLRQGPAALMCDGCDVCAAAATAINNKGDDTVLRQSHSVWSNVSHFTGLRLPRHSSKRRSSWQQLKVSGERKKTTSRKLCLLNEEYQNERRDEKLNKSPPMLKCRD